VNLGMPGRGGDGLYVILNGNDGADGIQERFLKLTE